MEFPDSMTLGAARDRLRELVKAGGHECPCCKRLAKIYVRPLGATSARAIVALYRDHKREYGHMPTVVAARLSEVAHQGGYATLGAHWGLIEEEVTLRPDGGRAGFWRVTDKGMNWMRGDVRVPRSVVLYANRVQRFEGEAISIRDSLGTKFNYAEIMAGLELSAAPTAQDALQGALELSIDNAAPAGDSHYSQEVWG